MAGEQLTLPGWLRTDTPRPSKKGCEGLVLWFCNRAQAPLMAPWGLKAPLVRQTSRGGAFPRAVESRNTPDLLCASEMRF